MRVAASKKKSGCLLATTTLPELPACFDLIQKFPLPGSRCTTQVYSNSCLLPTDAPARNRLVHDLPAPPRRTLEDVLRDADDVARVRQESTAAAAKARAQGCGIHRRSPFFGLTSGFGLDQIRPDMAHSLAILVRHLLQVNSAPAARETEQSEGHNRTVWDQSSAKEAEVQGPCSSG